MFKIIKKYFEDKIQSDKLKSDIAKREKNLKEEMEKLNYWYQRRNNIPTKKTEDLIKTIAEQQTVKNP